MYFVQFKEFKFLAMFIVNNVIYEHGKVEMGRSL